MSSKCYNKIKEYTRTPAAPAESEDVMNENLIGYIDDILDEYKDQEIAKQAGAYEAALYMIKIHLEILNKSNTPESNEKPLF